MQVNNNVQAKDWPASISVAISGSVQYVLYLLKIKLLLLLLLFKKKDLR